MGAMPAADRGGQRMVTWPRVSEIRNRRRAALLFLCCCPKCPSSLGKIAFSYGWEWTVQFFFEG